jgi:RNA polymerase sigma-70 factor (ECF subfamily)
MAAAESLTDLQLLERIATRDMSAVAALYDRHSRALYSLIHRILRDVGDAEDVLQEVFLRVWEKADTYDPVLGSPMAWLVRIGRNRAIDRVRAKRSRPATEQSSDTIDERLVDMPGSGPSPERLTSASEEQRALAGALSRLAPEQRVLIEHAFFLGLTQSELAERFKLPLGTVKTRIRTGMLAMREHLQHLACPEQGRGV